jgi:membrane protein YqaA with SNARE-associated domain
MFEFSASSGLVGLALSSFLSATLLPGSSEVILLAVLQQHPPQWAWAVGIATLGNTLGAMTSYLIGRVLPDRADLRGIERVRRYGYPVLLLSWVPFVGDALPLAAGWLRLRPWWSALFVAAGKLARYLALAGAWPWLAAA